MLNRLKKGISFLLCLLMLMGTMVCNAEKPDESVQDETVESEAVESEDIEVNVGD